MKNKYPNTIVEKLEKLLKYKQYRQHSLDLFDYMFSKIYFNNERWVEIPRDTLWSILGKNNYIKILNALSPFIVKSKDYSTGTEYNKPYCKSYCFTNLFISHFNDSLNWTDFVDYIKTIKSGVLVKKEEVVISSKSLNDNSSIMCPDFLDDNSSIMCPDFLDDNSLETSIYTIDYDKITEVSKEIFSEDKYTSKLNRIAAIQCAKTNLTNILSDNVKVSISDKNLRHHTSITLLQKELRECLLKNGKAFYGQMDLKCCHGFTTLWSMKEELSNEEFDILYNLFSNPNLWSILMDKSGIKTKDAVKDKFQLFLNGNRRQNIGNPIYNIFIKDYTRFTEILFAVKDNKEYNHSNAMASIEASVMHSKELEAYLLSNNINCDTIHDCLWLYGDIDKQVILDTAQFILRLFKDMHHISMVFTLEIVGMDKEIIKEEIKPTSIIDDPQWQEMIRIDNERREQENQMLLNRPKSKYKPLDYIP
jgi:hypothetical protein